MKVLVSDTSVLIDLDRGVLVEAAFRLPFAFTVPDVLYERELRKHGGPDLVELGLRVEELDGDDGIDGASLEGMHGGGPGAPTARSRTSVMTWMSDGCAISTCIGYSNSRQLREDLSTGRLGIDTNCEDGLATACWGRQNGRRLCRARR